MAKISTGQARRFAAGFLKTMDPDQAARAAGRSDGTEMLEDPGVLQEVERRRLLQQQQLRREDVLRRLAELAFGPANDCVRLVLEPQPEVEGLDLSLLTEVKRNEKGTVEIKLVDRLAVLERLAEMTDSDGENPLAFLEALGREGEPD